MMGMLAQGIAKVDVRTVTGDFLLAEAASIQVGFHVKDHIQ